MIICVLSSFRMFDLPVFGPVLVAYFILLFCLTMKERVRHMVRHRYLPWYSEADV